MFSDESLFILDFLDMRGRVWRRRDEWHANVTKRFHDSYGCESIMVWGGIIMTKRTFFCIQQRRINGQYHRCNRPYSIPTVQTKPGVKGA